jgi:hypothetical protein
MLGHRGNDQEPAYESPVTTRVSDGTSQRLAGGARHYAVVMLACFGLVGGLWLLSAPGAEQPPSQVDVAQAAARFRAVAPYQTYAPPDVPAGWRATSSRITGTAGEGPVAWHLGHLTARGQYAAVVQSDESPAAFVPRMTNRDGPVGGQQVAGATWERYFRSDKKQYSLVRRLPGVTIVVTGTAPYHDLAVLAAALRPQPGG